MGRRLWPSRKARSFRSDGVFAGPQPGNSEVGAEEKRHDSGGCKVRPVGVACERDENCLAFDTCLDDRVDGVVSDGAGRADF